MHFFATTSRLLKRLARYLLPVFALSLLTIFTASAEGNGIVVVYQKDKSFSVTIANSILANLQSNNIDSGLVSLQSLEKNRESTSKSRLIVSLGSEPTNKLLAMKVKTPVLSLLIPKQAYPALKDNKKDGNPWATLFIDQPVDRQLLLIKHLFGKQQTIGILLGPYSAREKRALLSTARKRGQKLSVESIQNTDQLIPALRSLTNTSDILLALPDPVAFNKKTIRGILLLTYRENIPVVGFSKSYVRAGAIASLYSEYEQISNQAHIIISNFLRTGRFDRNIYYPSDFSLAINRKVARTLNIRLKPKEEIIRLIKQDEGKR